VAADYEATIDWGDGTLEDEGVIAGSGGSLPFPARHSYLEAGTYSIHVTIAGLRGARTWTRQPGATVNEPGIIALAGSVTATEGWSLDDATVATFTSDDPNLTGGRLPGHCLLGGWLGQAHGLKSLETTTGVRGDRLA